MDRKKIIEQRVRIQIHTLEKYLQHVSLSYRDALAEIASTKPLLKPEDFKSLRFYIRYLTIIINKNTFTNWHM